MSEISPQRKPNRVQTNFLAKAEKRLLGAICPRLPAWVTPDGLTALSLFGALISFGAYIAAGFHPAALFLASFGLVVYWFGDSLDGSLARYRQIERPRYGYFIDHSVDCLSNLAVMAGLGLSSYVRLDVALLALLGYYLLGIHVYLSAYVVNEFQLTFLAAGPTELRLALIILNTTIYFVGSWPLRAFGAEVSAYDLPVSLAAAIFFLLFLNSTWRRAAALFKEEARL